MKNHMFSLLSGLLLSSTMACYSQDVIFLHHSTGGGVFNEGNVAGWFDNYNSQHSTDYNITEKSYPNTPYPWANYPYDYWNLWANNVCDNADPDIACLSSLCNSYDVIIFKHCFPGAGILADDQSPSVSSEKKTLANYKLQYRVLRDLMDGYPNNKFIVWTLAPLHRLDTDPSDAERARQFVDWVKNEWLTEDGKGHPNIHIFDFFGYVAESDATPVNGKVNCLKYDYEGSHTESDSHPNTLANTTVGPIFAQFIVNTIENQNLPTGLETNDKAPVAIIVRKSELSIQTEGDKSYNYVRICNLLGSFVMNRYLDSNDGLYDISFLSSGIYFVLLSGDDGNPNAIKICKP